MSAFASKLEQVINKKGITKKDLSQKIGITAASISDFTKGKSYPTPETLKGTIESLELNPIDIEELIRLYCNENPRRTKSVEHAIFSSPYIMTSLFSHLLSVVPFVWGYENVDEVNQLFKIAANELPSLINTILYNEKSDDGINRILAHIYGDANLLTLLRFCSQSYENAHKIGLFRIKLNYPLRPSSLTDFSINCHELADVFKDLIMTTEDKSKHLITKLSNLLSEIDNVEKSILMDMIENLIWNFNKLRDYHK